jgi:cytochrome d ubiquinol oxidase subunit II
VRPGGFTAFADHPWRLVFPVLAVGALGAVALLHRRRQAGRAFLASCAFIAGLLGSVAAGLYPSILPARQGRPNGLTVDNAAASDHALRIALWWWPVGIALAVGYFVLAYRLHLTRRRTGPA